MKCSCGQSDWKYIGMFDVKRNEYECVHCKKISKFSLEDAAKHYGKETDSINHPKHYNAHPSGVECITVVEHMNFNRGNAIKYIWRAGDKGNEIEDLKKAAWYIAREIEKCQKETSKT